jgi:hypothetical protein
MRTIAQRRLPDVVRETTEAAIAIEVSSPRGLWVGARFIPDQEPST